MKSYKRLLSMFLACTLTAGALPITALAARVGDVNGDGAVDEKDVDILSKYFAGWSAYAAEDAFNRDAADIDGNNLLERIDAMKLARNVDKWDGYELPEYTVSFCLLFDGAISNSEAFKNRFVYENTVIEQPQNPSSDYMTFVGWYTDLSYTTEFDFSVPITADTTVFAKWEFDTTDTDGDGLYNDMERYFGTDINSSDSDEDGISDYDEAMIIGTNPLKADTDEDGIGDADEDDDEDGLTNIDELTLGTSMILSDTDLDGLSDYDEINVYGTDPLLEDTDGDGATDGVEVTYGTDPTKANDSFIDYDESQPVSENNPVAASVEADIPGEALGSVVVNPVLYTDNPFMSATIPGYMGTAYEFTASEDINSATITFTYDTSLGTVGDDFQPRIFYFNEETQGFEELPNQIVEDGKITAEVSHFSVYASIDTVTYYSTYEDKQKVIVDELSKPGAIEGDKNNDGILDVYDELIYKGILTLKNGAAAFVGFNFGEMEADADGDGLLNGEEILIYRDPITTEIYIHMESNPLLLDTDSDGIFDDDDTTDLYSFNGQAVEFLTDYENFLSFQYVYDVFNFDEFKDWSIAVKLGLGSFLDQGWDTEEETKEVFKKAYLDYFNYYGVDIAESYQSIYLKNQVISGFKDAIDAVGTYVLDGYSTGNNVVETIVISKESYDRLNEISKELKFRDSFESDAIKNGSIEYWSDAFKHHHNLRVSNLLNEHEALKLKLSHYNIKFNHGSVQGTIDAFKQGNLLSKMDIAAISLTVVTTAAECWNIHNMYSAADANIELFNQCISVFERLQKEGWTGYAQSAAKEICEALKEEGESFCEQRNAAIADEIVDGAFKVAGVVLGAVIGLGPWYTCVKLAISLLSIGLIKDTQNIIAMIANETLAIAFHNEFVYCADIMLEGTSDGNWQFKEEYKENVDLLIAYLYHLSNLRYYGEYLYCECFGAKDDLAQCKINQNKIIDSAAKLSLIMSDNFLVEYSLNNLKFNVNCKFTKIVYRDINNPLPPDPSGKNYSTSPVSNAVIYINGFPIARTTDKYGFCEMVLRPGDQIITLYYPEEQTGAGEREWVPCTYYLDVEKGETYNLDFVAFKSSQKSPNSNSGLQPKTYTISGNVQRSETGGALENAVIKFRPDFGNKISEYIDIPACYTDSTGKYSVTLPIGCYTMEVSKNGYVTAYVNVVVEESKTIETVSLEDGEMLYTLSGTVTDGTNPLKGVTVNLSTITKARASALTYSTETDAQGHYSFDVPVGSYLLEFQKSGYSFESITVDVDGKSETITAETITLQALPAVFSVTHTYNNITTDILASSPIEVYNGKASMTWTVASPDEWTVSKSGDWFSIDKTGGAAGETELKITIPAGTAAERTGTITFTTKTDGQTYTVRIKQIPSTVTGKITLIDGTTPITNAQVTISNAAYTAPIAVTGDDGKFTVALPNGWYDITVAAEGYETITFAGYFEVNEDNVDIGIRTIPVKLTGTVTDSSTGGKLSGVTVKLNNSEGEEAGTATSDTNGVFSFSFYTEDTYSLTFTKTGYQTKTEENISITKDSSAIGQFSLAVKKNPQYVMKYYNDHTYLVIDNELSWDDAQKFCERLGGHLVTITSKEENDFLMNRELYLRDDNKVVYPGLMGVWIGFSKAGTGGVWQWVTDENANFTDWSGVSPENTTGTDYAFLITHDFSTQGLPKGWHNFTTEYNYYQRRFVCEWDSIVDESVYTIDSGTCGDNLTWELDVSGTLTISGTGDMYDFNYQGTDMPWADYKDNVITNVIIKEGVTSIGNNAFNGVDFDIYAIHGMDDEIQSYSGSISFPSTLSSIGNYAFAYTRDIPALYLPEGLEIIGSYAFNNSWIAKIYIPATVNKIGYYFDPDYVYDNTQNPFVSCRELSEINVASDNPYFCSVDGVLYTKDMGTLVAYPEGKSSESYIMPNSVHTIIDNAFGSLNFTEHLKNLTISAKLEDLSSLYFVKNFAYFNVDSANQNFCSVDGVIYSKDKKRIELYPPANHAVQYDILDGTEIISGCSFADCNYLLTLNIPESVYLIEYAAIQSCHFLNNLVLPEGITFGGSNAINQCDRLSNIYFMGDAPEFFADNIIYHWKDVGLTLYCIEGKQGWTVPEWTGGGKTYRTAYFDPDTFDTNIIIDGTTETNISWVLDSQGTLSITGNGILNNIFTKYGQPLYEYRHLIQKVIISEGITEITDSVFYDFNTLHTVFLPNTLTMIGDEAFQRCSSLKNINLPNSVISIGKWAFSYCITLEEVVLSNQLKSIGEWAFSGCDQLEAIVITDNVDVISSYTFYSCDNLKDVYFLGNVPSVWGSSMFGYSDFPTLHYISGKTGWDTPTWNAPDGTVYNTAIFEP